MLSSNGHSRVVVLKFGVESMDRGPIHNLVNVPLQVLRLEIQIGREKVACVVIDEIDGFLQGCVRLLGFEVFSKFRTRFVKLLALV